MIIKIKRGIIYAVEEGQEDRKIGALDERATDEDERLIECGSETISAVEEFIKEVNSGKFKPRAVVRRFEEILKKHAV